MPREEGRSGEVPHLGLYSEGPAGPGRSQGPAIWAPLEGPGPGKQQNSGSLATQRSNSEDQESGGCGPSTGEVTGAWLELNPPW